MSESIHFIGDSHSVLTFGQTVLAQLSEYEPYIHMLSFSGLKLQYATDWKRQPGHLSILNFEKRPGGEGVFSKDPFQLGRDFAIAGRATQGAETVVVALGTNDIIECVNRNLDYTGEIQNKIESEIKKISAKRIIFIEPPLLAIDVDKTIRKHLLDSMATIKSRIISCGNYKADQNDGIHMNKDMAYSYGLHVAGQLKSELK